MGIAVMDESGNLKADSDPTDRLTALHQVATHQARGEALTGLLYVDPQARDLHAVLTTSATALNALGTDKQCPGVDKLAKLNASLR